MPETIQSSDPGHLRSASADKAKYEILVVTKLTQIGHIVADIHRLVSPPEDETGDRLVDVMSRIADGIDHINKTLGDFGEQQDRIEERLGVVEMVVKVTDGHRP